MDGRANSNSLDLQVNSKKSKPHFNACVYGAYCLLPVLDFTHFKAYFLQLHQGDLFSLPEGTKHSTFIHQ
jgi:hypothetical protein